VDDEEAQGRGHALGSCFDGAQQRREQSRRATRRT